MKAASLLCKRKAEDDLETKPVLRKHKDKEIKSDEANLISDNTLLFDKLSPETESSDIISFFKDVGEVVRVKLILDLNGNRLGYGFVEFASANEAKKAFEKKNGEYLRDSKIYLEVANKRAQYLLPPKYFLDHKVWYQENYLQPIQEDEASSNSVEEVLLVANLSPQTTKIEHIIDFFEDVGDVVGVRLIVNHKCKHVGYCFVEFASSYQAKRALKEKNGECLYDHPVLLMKGLDETLESVEADAARNKTLFVANFGRQTKIPKIINFFENVGEVVHIRLIVDHKVNHVGFGCVEFASSEEAKKALEKKKGEYLNNRKTDLDVFKPSRFSRHPKFCVDHKVWYKDEATVEELEEAEVRKKTLFFTKWSSKTRIKTIIDIFKGVGEVVRVQLIANERGQFMGCGFLEFASATETNNVLKSKKGARIYLSSVEIARYPLRLKYNLVEKLWYEDNLRRETLDLRSTQKEFEFCGRKTTFSNNE